MAKRLSVTEKQLRSVSERNWQAMVIKLAENRGWKHYHAPDNKPVNGRIQKIVAGFPDLVMVKGNRLIFAELKRELGKVSPEQESWLYALKIAGAECYIWRPSDLKQVVEILEKSPSI